MPNNAQIEDVYLEAPNTCPYCMASLQAGGFSSDTHVGYVNTWCEDCHAEFTETYRLESVEVNKVGGAVKEKAIAIHPVLFDHLVNTLKEDYVGETERDIEYDDDVVFDDGIVMVIQVVRGKPYYAQTVLNKDGSEVATSDVSEVLGGVWELMYEGVLYKVDVQRAR